MKDINEVLLNPTRLRIVQELAKHESLNTLELCDRLDDVPRTSMYRHIRLLLETRVVSIISEKRVRGSEERTLALNTTEINQGNTLERASHNELVFLLSKYARFHTYFSGKSPNPGKDRIFLNNTVLMVTDEEYDQFLSELRDLLIRYSYEADEGRRPRDISILSAPVETEKEQAIS